MQIVIDIDEDLYKHIKNSYIFREGMRTGKSFMAVVYNAIANGKPLPKGHGRLIDEEQITGDGGWDFSDRLMLTPTIIEADISGKEQIWKL